MGTHIDYSSGASYGTSGQGVTPTGQVVGEVNDKSTLVNGPNNYPFTLDRFREWLQTAFSQTQELDQAEMAFNSGEAQKNRDWQELMSNTAYQRAVADLEKAGLNKWLAVNGGSLGAASTPSGSSASASTGSETVSKLLKAFISYAASMNSTALRSFLSLIDFF